MLLVLPHPHRFPLRPFVPWLSCLTLLGAFQVPDWAGRPVALTDGRLTPGFHFLPFSGFRSFWQEEVEGPWDAESRGLTPGQRNRASC